MLAWMNIVAIVLMIIVAFVAWEITNHIIDMNSNLAFYGGWAIRIVMFGGIAYTIHERIRKIIRSMKE